MGFGTLPCLDDANQQRFSPRPRPQKRPLHVTDDAEQDHAPLDAATPNKVARMDLLGDSPPSASTSVGPSCAATSDASSPVDRSEVPGLNEGSGNPLHLPRQREDYGGLESAVDVAMNIFREALIEFAIECDAGNADKETRENRAARVCESSVCKKYEEMKSALLDLLPWVGPVQSTSEESGYKVVELEGHQPPRHLEKSLEDSELLKAQLAWLRDEPRGRAWEAFCAIMAALSTRKEKCWLDAHDRDALDEQLGPKLKLRGEGAQRRNTIRAYVEGTLSEGRGFFSHFLVHPNTTLRVALVPGAHRATPASLVITYRLPMWEALHSMDDCGPLRGEAASQEWCLQAGRQFALQDANLSTERGSRNDRVDVAKLKPDPALRDLLCSSKPVLVLEVVAALAPRDVAKKQGIADIVKRELARVMHDAQNRGEAVVFCLGSDRPHALARKVYFRQPICDHGLRCGYLRWRASNDAPWGRDRAWTDRLCLCLQMP